MNKDWEFRENSLDAIRLLAAMQIVILHSVENMYPQYIETIIFRFIELFPGVPIFFFVSGYLVSKSFERAPHVKEYAKNRILRLYPALIICVAINIFMVWWSGYFETSEPSTSDLGLLFLAKASFIQFWNPEFMRGFGDGVLNGSLWTICVEVQFYVLTPLLYFIFGKGKNVGNGILAFLMIFFMVANRALYEMADTYSSHTIWKLYRVSFVPWLYMFIVGVIVQRNFDFFANFVQKVPAFAALAFYVGASYFLTKSGYATGNAVSPISFFIVCFLVFRFSYCKTQAVNQFMRGNDISYGIYIWHMPIINQFLYLGYGDAPEFIYYAIALTFILAIVSWYFFEKPALKLKRFTLNLNVKSKSS